MIRRVGLCLRIALLYAGLTAASPASARSQVIGFVHGFGSGGDTWNSLLSSLHDSLQFRSVAPTLNWEFGVAIQAAALNADYGATLGSSPFLVGHSAGGIISRQYGASFGAAGVLTIGSPHAGAPIARNYPWVAQVGNDALSDAFFLADSYGDDFVERFGDWLYGYLQDWGLWPLVCEAAGVTTNLFDNFTNSPIFIVDNLEPGSSYLLGLSLQAGPEQANIGKRASIAVTMDQWSQGGPWRVLYGASAGLAESERIIDLGLVAISAGAILLNHSYIGEDNPYLYYSRGMAFMDLGESLLLIDPTWCLAVSQNGCQASDGFIPTASQKWGEHQLLVNRNISHIEETRQLTSEIQGQLISVFQIPRQP
ncbi:MAG: alpha/beta hydrolase [bacterium]|jgi:pimeloyl-ACP methyl ester carboxylesterase